MHPPRGQLLCLQALCDVPKLPQLLRSQLLNPQPQTITAAARRNADAAAECLAAARFNASQMDAVKAALTAQPFALIQVGIHFPGGV